MKIFKDFLLKAKNKNENYYFTEILNDLIQFKEKINIKNIFPNYWIEIDNIKDLRNAIKNKSKLKI